MLGRKIFYITLAFISMVWAIFFMGEADVFNKGTYIISERNGLLSIITGPFLHADLGHIVGNTKMLLLTMPLIQYFYKKDFYILTLLGIILPAITVYFAGLSVLGISGLTYTYVWFLILSGIGSKDKYRFICSIAFIVFYGGSLAGITPLAGFGVSWHTHLFGVVVALVYSVYRYLRK